MPKRLVLVLASLLIPTLIGLALVWPSSEPTPAVLDLPSATALCETPGVCEPQTQGTSTALEKKLEGNATVVRTVDGDTFIAMIDGQTEEQTVRLLGIDTPETVDPRRPVQCFGKEASQKLADLVQGKRVHLEDDPQADERDKYGRLLRNVLLEDGTDVNALMVRDGFAYAYLSFPLNRERKRDLKTLQELAKASALGLWSKDACPVNS